MIRIGVRVTQQDFSEACPQTDDLFTGTVEVRWRTKCSRGKNPASQSEAGLGPGEPGGERILSGSALLFRRLCCLALALERLLPATAVHGHLEDDAVVDETVDGGERHGLVGEDVVPFAERLIGGNRQRSPLVAHGNQLEQDAGLGLLLGDGGAVVEDQQVELVELGDGCFQAQLAVGHLQLLEELSGANEQYTPSLLEESMPEPGRKVQIGR